MLVKIVRPEDQRSGTTVEGTIAEIVTKDDHDERGIEVRLSSGETGRVLRVWERGLAPPESSRGRAQAALPSYAEPAPEPTHWKHRIPQSELERQVREVLGPLTRDDVQEMIERHQDGLSGSLLKRFGLKSEEVEAKTRELLSSVDDEELEKRLSGGPDPSREDQDER
jgi:uncharacterized repeat protein (TIGR03833 family)